MTVMVRRRFGVELGLTGVILITQLEGNDEKTKFLLNKN